MKEHYDIALHGLWWAVNYGSQLNGYAVYKILESLNYSVLMIMKPDADENDWELIPNQHNMKFVKKVYPESAISPSMPISDLYKLNSICDTFMAGSDQLWNHYINSGFKMSFLLGFVDENKKKISFGTSFGQGFDITPDDELPNAKKLMQRFNGISVREKSGVEICREKYGVKAKQVIEPVFCITYEEYDELARLSDFNVPQKPYILTYILDPTPEKRQAIIDYCNLTGMESINILDGDPRFTQSNKNNLNLPNTFESIMAYDFVKLYKNCSFVITDAFHGTAFSIIFNKPFISIANSKRGTVRFYDLLGKYDLLDRLIEENDLIPIERKFLKKIEYRHINQQIKKERENSIGWIKQILETPLDKLPNIVIAKNAVTQKLDKKMCTGCGACVSVCPTAALSLQPDEYGFYRSTIEVERCINCGKCTMVCPAIKLPPNKNEKEPTLYEFVAADDKILEKSSSGGVFTLLANEAFKKKGTVYGAAWRDDFSVEHIGIDKEEDLYKLQKSKYLQSYTGNIFRNIKEKLDKDEFVLFSGCPCQVAGLRAYLGKEYENLLAVDILCSHVPSAMFFQKYIDEEFGNNIKCYEFRAKGNSIPWDCNHVRIIDKLNIATVRSGAKEDNYQRVFHNHTMTPIHCENCKYQIAPRFGDITIGDFWGIQNKDNQINTSKGVAAVMCNNEKGVRFFNEIPSNSIKEKKVVPLSWLCGNGYVTGVSRNYASRYRNTFFEAIKTMTFSQAVNYALKPNHGMYNEIYANSDTILRYDTEFLKWRFETNIWEEHMINGKMLLIVKPNSIGPGHYACMPLSKPLKRGNEYILKIRFKIKSTSHWLNLHVKDSGSNIFQIVHSCNIEGRNWGNEWIDLEIRFKADSNLYDEFMIGASQVSGENNYIAFQYINLKCDTSSK